MTETINPNSSKHHHEKGLAEGSWKGMKKYLEQNMLCEALRGRISYDFTWYPAFGGSSAVFTVLLDSRPAKKFGAAYACKMLTQQGFEIQYVDAVDRVPFAERERNTPTGNSVMPSELTAVRPLLLPSPAATPSSGCLPLLTGVSGNDGWNG